MARGPQLITIYWRDIPAQVNAKTRGEKYQRLLKPRFQKAIDRAAMVADITTSNEYVAEWRQEIKPIDSNSGLEAVALAEAELLDTSFDQARLDQYVKNGGWNPATSLVDETPQNANTDEVPKAGDTA